MDEKKEGKTVGKLELRHTNKGAVTLRVVLFNRKEKDEKGERSAEEGLQMIKTVSAQLKKVHQSDTRDIRKNL